MVSKKIKNEMKDISKEMKILRKLSKKDYRESIKVSDDLIVKVTNLMMKDEIIKDVKTLLNLKKIKDSLLVYNSVFASVEGFKEKWEK